MAQQNNSTYQKDSKVTSQKTAWVAGASGLIGGHLLEQLCNNPLYTHVIAFVRAQPSDNAFTHDKLQYFTCDWPALLNDPSKFNAPASNVTSLFCALGSTKSKTPNKSEYYTIDVEYPEAFAKLGLSHGASYYGLVSSNSASTSSLSSYLKMKGKVEQAVHALDYPHFAIAQPSLLLGNRHETRLLESASEFACKLLPGNLKAIQAHDVAAALIQASVSDHQGREVLASKSMQGALNADQR